MTAPETGAAQRLDRWLWFARIFKSRSLATKTVEEGAVRVTRANATIRTDKASYPVRPGDVVTVKVHDRVRVLEILSGGTRRGPAKEAQTLYRDLSASLPSAPSDSKSPKPSTRPDKRDRRAIERLKSSGRPDEVE